MDIAEHQVVRFRLLPTATGTDLALALGATVPEPAAGAIVTLGLLGIAVRRNRGSGVRSETKV